MADTDPQKNSAEVASTRDLVRKRMLEWFGGGTDDRDDGSPEEWIVRRYCDMAPAQQKSLARACALSLTDPEPKVRGGAIQFFSDLLDAADDGLLLDAVRNHARLFKGVPDPFIPDSTLWEELLRTTTGRLNLQDPNQRDIVREFALTLGQAEIMISRLWRSDMAWVEAHLIDILRGSPQATAVVLYNLVEHKRPLLPVIESLLGIVAPTTLAEAIRAKLPADQQARALDLLPK